MRLLVSRYPGLVSRNITWRLRLNSSRNPGLNLKARLGVMQTRMAHVVPPPAPPFPSHHDKTSSMGQVLAFGFYFKDLFRRSPPDLPEQLLAAIKPNLGLTCAIALASSLFWAKSLDVSIRSVVQVLPQTPDVIIENDTGYDDPHKPGSFRDRFKALVIFFLCQHMQGVLPSKQALHIPTYRIFTAALFSASAVKNGLLDESFIYGFTRYGLQLSPSENFEAKGKEVAAIGAVGACLQLITAGSAFMEKHFAKTNSLADIVAALETLKAKNIIDHPGELDLLEKTIEAAKANFANPLSASDAWDILSPTGEFSWWGADE